MTLEYRNMPGTRLDRNRLVRRMPRVFSQALNDTGFEIRRKGRRLMRRVFRAPTRWTLGGQEVIKATPTKPTMRIAYKSRDRGQRAAGDYLERQEVGGARKPKPFEAALRRKRFIGAGEFVIPVKGGPLDVAPNRRGGPCSQLVSRARLRSDAPIVRKRPGGGKHRPSSGYTYVRAGQLILRRSAAGRKTERAAVIGKQPSYSPRFGWQATVQRTNSELLPKALNARARRALGR